MKIYGPPGTGKTTTLLEKVRAALDDGVLPSEIGFFSYTNKATEEAKGRMVEKFPHYKVDEDFPYFQTVHSLAVQSLRTRVVVITDKQAREFDRGVVVERPLMKEGDESSQVIRVKHPVLDASSTARALKVPLSRHLSALPENQRWPINKWLGRPKRHWEFPLSDSDIQDCVAYNERYEQYKEALGVIDYTDMLERALEDPAGLPHLKLLLIDEAQDLNPLQWDLARVLIDRAERCFVAGDDDQAICESFGASARHLVELPVPGENEVVLRESNRVPPAIHDALAPLVTELSRRFPYRKAKTWMPKKSSQPGKVGRFEDAEEFLASIVFDKPRSCGKSILLMFPTNATLQQVSRRLSQKGVSHYAANKLEGSGDPQIRLLTIWGAKGGEADITALIVDSDMDKKMLRDDPRLEYVAHTRAMEEHYCVGDWLALTGASSVEQGQKRVEATRSGNAQALSPESVDRLRERFGKAPN